MRILSKKEIQKIATEILAKHGALGASLTVTGKGGGVNLGKLQTTLSAPKKKETPLGSMSETATDKTKNASGH